MENYNSKEFIEKRVKNLRFIKNMNDGIKSSGGLFYQYRPCRIDENIIYDIENITHGVVYARSPLYMNDPFDSEIGFSTDKVIDDIIDMYLESYQGEETTKKLLGFIIKNKLLGKFAEVLKGLNELKKELNVILPQDLSPQQVNYVRHHIESEVKKLPKNIQKIFNKKNINNILFLILGINAIEITEQNICDVVWAQEALNKAVEEINRIKTTVFEEAYRKFLLTLNISCFTASGWNNPLMWAHYANSYEGICIEYDFNKIKDFIGFIFPVDYSRSRPIISIRDMCAIKDNNIEYLEIKDETVWELINYLLVKDKVWEYEKEWRIIDPQDTPDKPSFIPLPFIKSITLGTKVKPLIKNWIISICSDKDIDCYELKLSYDTFNIDRVPIDLKNYNYDIEDENNFLLFLGNRLDEQTKDIESFTEKINDNNENNVFDYDLIMKSLATYNDIAITCYFTKIVVNRIALKNEDLLVQYKHSISEIISNINAFISQKEVFSNLKNSTVSFMLSGKITFKQKKSLDKKLDDILNVIKYYSEQEWAVDGLLN